MADQYDAMGAAGAAAVGGSVGAAVYGTIGGIGIAGGFGAVGITLGPFIAIGTGIGLTGYGLFWLGKQFAGTPPPGGPTQPPAYNPPNPPLGNPPSTGG